MARFSRILTGFESSPAAANQPEYVNVESDFVVILAALLCALICTIGLIAVTRCAWLRRRAGGSASSSTTSSAANKGLKKKVLHSLPKFTYGASGSSVAGVDPCKFAAAECAICLGEFSDGEVIRVLPQCGHGFHVGCIDTWLGSHSTCPSCRQILVVAICRKCGSSDDSKAASRVHNVTDNATCSTPTAATANQTSIVINGEYLP